MTTKRQKDFEDAFEAEAEGLLFGQHKQQLRPRRPARAKIWRVCIGILYMVLAAFSAFGMFSLAQDILYKQAHTRSHDSHDIHDVCYCGKNVSEATARGCRYDSIAVKWLPARCRDDSLIDAFNNAGPHGPWEFYSDANRTVAYSLDDVAALADTGGFFWATHRWHIVHCMYTWKKLYRQQFTGVTIEPHSDTMFHIQHCEEVAQMEFGFDDLVTQARLWLNPDVIHQGNWTKPETAA